ncbi:helix-turn-helix transcriptional regulator [Paenibacillus hamazuiensis]|uniref:helix-turn-helix transcriptional regulator n=1 Tax=Paenibacillus hamazuiensis TaxID=2936508 RepID=UPI00200F30D9|nr:YafY family protein [Paenibacillus hamazuiensis]
MKLHRLLAITMLLLSRKRMSGQELADRFEVSLRTIYRDLETINSAGIPVISYAGADGGYEIMDQYRIDRQMVTLEELHSIVTALRGMQASLEDKDMDHLLAKVGALVAKSEQNRLEDSGEPLIFDTRPWCGTQAEKETMTRLRQAAKSRNVVRFFYTNADGIGTERTVEPVGLAWKGYAWFLYAYCRLRGDYRTFRLTRIKQLRVELEVFPRRDVRLEDLDARWMQRERSDRIRMVLRFHPRVRVKVEEYFGEERIAVQEDGYLLVTAEHSAEGWLIGHLLGHGTDVLVIEPKWLADAVREKAEQIVRQYRDE